LEAFTLLNSQRDTSEDLRTKIVATLFTRYEKGGISSMAAIVSQLLVHNYEISRLICLQMKATKKEVFENELLALDFSSFLKIMHITFEFTAERALILSMLDRRRELQGKKYYPFISSLRGHEFAFFLIYLENVASEKEEAFFTELEEARAALSGSIFQFTMALRSKDPQIARFFFNKHAKIDLGSIIGELKAAPMKDYFNHFLNIYEFWITGNLYPDTYPTILEDVFSRIDAIITENKALADPNMENLATLFECINALMLSYKTTLDDTGYPMGERFNPLFLRAFETMLDPKNAVTDKMVSVVAIAKALRAAKNEMLDDLIKPEFFDAIEHFLRSMLNFFSLNLKDYFLIGSLTKGEFKKFLAQNNHLLDAAKHMMILQIVDRWMPRLLEKGMDNSYALAHLLHTCAYDKMPEATKKVFFERLEEVLTSYLTRFKPSYAAKKPPAIIEEIMVYLKPAKKSARADKQAYIMDALHTIKEDDRSDFIYHTFFSKLSEAKIFLGKE